MRNERKCFFTALVVEEEEEEEDGKRERKDLLEVHKKKKRGNLDSRKLAAAHFKTFITSNIYSSSIPCQCL